MEEATTPSIEPIPHHTFSTAGVEARHQAEAWSSILSVMSVQSRRPQAHGFRGEAHSWNLGRLNLTRLNVQAADLQRDGTRLRADAIDHWYFSIPISGTYFAEDGVVTGPGQCQANTLRRPNATWQTDIDAIFLTVPRDVCSSHALVLDQMSASNLAPGLGGLLADYLKSLQQRLPSIDAEQLPALAEATRAMIIACAAPGRDTLAEALSVVRATQLERAKQFIRQHLFAPHLGVKALSRHLGMSRTSLYRLFEPLGGVVHYVRLARLHDAHRVLSSGSDLRPIHEIAAERGFDDPSEFSRAFKRQFGYSPREARNEGRPMPTRTAGTHAASVANFGEVLSALA